MDQQKLNNLPFEVAPMCRADFTFITNQFVNHFH